MSRKSFFTLNHSLFHFSFRSLSNICKFCPVTLHFLLSHKLLRKPGYNVMIMFWGEHFSMNSWPNIKKTIIKKKKEKKKKNFKKTQFRLNLNYHQMNQTIPPTPEKKKNFDKQNFSFWFKLINWKTKSLFLWFKGFEIAAKIRMQLGSSVDWFIMERA